jgi:hypothetical protein
VEQGSCKNSEVPAVFGIPISPNYMMFLLASCNGENAGDCIGNLRADRRTGGKHGGPIQSACHPERMRGIA